jgi:hypothetical protein
MHHYKGDSGGRVLPLWKDSAGTQPNLAPGLLSYISTRAGFDVGADDLLAYLAALISHSGYTARFREELKTPGVRVPLSASSSVWERASALGREVIWLHTYGERYVDADLERLPGAPRLDLGVRPRVQARIPLTSEDMPDHIYYDENSHTLYVGSGQIAPVLPEVWNYQVSGMRVVRKWFGYRKKHPEVKRSSPLNDIHSVNWEAEATTDLLNLLTVLSRLVALEPAQGELLEQALVGPLITAAELEEVGVLPVPASARKASTRTRKVVPRGQEKFLL